jgi:hypothetical protein
MSKYTYLDENNKEQDIYSYTGGSSSRNDPLLKRALNQIEMDVIQQTLNENGDDNMDNFLLQPRLDRLAIQDDTDELRQELKIGLVKGATSDEIARSYVQQFNETIDAKPTRLSRDQIKQLGEANFEIYKTLSPGMKRWWGSKDGVTYRNHLNQILKIRYMKPTERKIWKRKQIFKSAFHTALAKEHDLNYFGYLENMRDANKQPALAMYHQNMKRKAKFYQNRNIDPKLVIDNWKPGKKAIYSNYNANDINLTELQAIGNAFSKRKAKSLGFQADPMNIYEYDPKELFRAKKIQKQIKQERGQDNYNDQVPIDQQL